MFFCEAPGMCVFVLTDSSRWTKLIYCMIFRLTHGIVGFYLSYKGHLFLDTDGDMLHLQQGFAQTRLKTKGEDQTSMIWMNYIMYIIIFYLLHI